MLLNLSDQNFQVGLLAIFIVWLFAITILIIKSQRHYRHLVGKTKKQDLKNILEAILETIKNQEQTSKEIISRLDKVDKRSFNYFQKIGFLRFNPFYDTGGDQSFVLSLLDGKDNGIILNSLHSRGTTRLYAKEIKKGEGENVKLSKEEKEVILKAKKRKALKND